MCSDHVEQFYNLSTLAYMELEHAHPNQHMVFLGVADILAGFHGLVALMVRAYHYKAVISQFFRRFQLFDRTN